MQSTSEFTVCMTAVIVIFVIGWLITRPAKKLRQENDSLSSCVPGSAQARAVLRAMAMRVSPRVKLDELPDDAKARMDSGAHFINSGDTTARNYYVYFTDAEGNDLSMTDVPSISGGSEPKIRNFVLQFNKYWSAPKKT